jgi:transcriptional regulator GlxA family with amidase domain
MAHTKIVFLVLPKMHLLDLAGPDQVFHEALEYGADLSIEYCSLGENVHTSSQFPLGRLKNFRDVTLQAGDHLIIPGASVDFLISKQMTAEKELMRWVNAAHARGANISSICTGAFFLALTGLLNGRKCTTHWKRTVELKKRFPKVNLMEDILFTEDDRIYTSAGVTAGIDLALFILSKLTDDHLSFKVARELVVYVRRAGADSQQSVFMKYRNHIHSGIHKAQDFVQENIRKKVTLDQLADKACMSARNLTRTFKRETGITVNEYTNLIRKEMLRAFAKNPDMSRKQMAKECGLSSERHVIRLMKAMPKRN